MKFKYKAIRVRQTSTGDWIVLFAASAIEIDKWVGIPQKKKIGEQETTGFQREENLKRIREIETFYKNEENIIQNPLLCALRQTSQGRVNFDVSSDGNNDFIQHGYLTIDYEPLEDYSLLQLLKKLKLDLESRVPELKEQRVSDKLITELKERAKQVHDVNMLNDEELLTDEIDNDIDSDIEEDVGMSFDESHILDFYEEVSAYISILEEIKDNFNEERFLDFSKEAIISFLRPIVVVDGQHRLRAAIKSAKTIVKNDYKNKIEEEILKAKDKVDPKQIQEKVEIEVARKLPISLLLNNDPAEQVFQFVVVNQKATPIKTSLLGTIVSTSLSNEELDRVADRLENAGIKLEESRAVTFLARNPKSPFYNLVERGLISDTKDRLKWNVLASIVRIFKDLKGGQIFGEKVDYADKWKRYHLSESKIVEKWEFEGSKDCFNYWQKLDGPWRDVFIEFWTVVRDKLADKDNNQAWHYWGDPKQSNIFNKTSLTILAADFFQYLTDRGLGIDSVDQVPSLVEAWLRGVSKDYFNRDWNLHGVKKDVPGIRKRWSTEWVQYRKDPKQLPKSNLYRMPLG